MKGRYRVFKAGALHHIYQRTYDGYLIFYSVRDFLVFFTLLCTTARKYKITVLGLCLMYDHIHVLVKAPSGKAGGGDHHHVPARNIRACRRAQRLPVLQDTGVGALPVCRRRDNDDRPESHDRPGGPCDTADMRYGPAHQHEKEGYCNP